MEELVSTYGKMLITLYAMLNPIGAIPSYLALTKDMSDHDRRPIPWQASLWICCLLLGSALAGEIILDLLGISLAAFRVGGGIPVLLMAVSMLSAQPSRIKQGPQEISDAEERDSISIVPLGTPLIAGPGSIGVAILYGNRTHTVPEYMSLMLVCILLGVGTYVVLVAADRISKRLGRNGINVISRLQGLILASIAIQIITTGLRELLPGLAG